MNRLGMRHGWRGVLVACVLLATGAACARSDGAAGAHAGAGGDALVEEARAFMDGYATDLRAGDRAGVAARYDRGGAYILGHGRKEHMPHEAIVAMYEAPEWSPPASFEWQDLSFEAAGPDAVAVTGRGLFGITGAPAPIEISYSGLLQRRDGALRIRVEHESFDPGSLPPAPADGGSDR